MADWSKLADCGPPNRLRRLPAFDPSQPLMSPGSRSAVERTADARHVDEFQIPSLELP